MKRITTTLISVTAFALLLSGCATASTPEPAPASTSKPAAVAAAAATAEPAVVLAGDVNGDGKLDAWEREHLVAPTYAMPDGTEVPLPALGEPLPAPVVAAVQAHVLAAGNLGAGPGAEKDTVDAKAFAAIEAESKALGRTVVPVLHTYDGVVGGARWCAAGPAAGRGCSYDRDEAVAFADAYVNGRTQFVVIAFG